MLRYSYTHFHSQQVVAISCGGTATGSLGKSVTTRGTPEVPLTVKTCSLGSKEIWLALLSSGMCRVASGGLLTYKSKTINIFNVWYNSLVLRLHVYCGLIPTPFSVTQSTTEDLVHFITCIIHIYRFWYIP